MSSVDGLDFSRMIQPVPATACLIDSDYYIWCAAMVRDDRRVCHLFYSRWPRVRGFHAWVTHSEVAHAVADTPLGPYRHVDVALSPRGADYWDGQCTHNPTVLEADGKYYLYHMGTRGDDVDEAADPAAVSWQYRNRQRIGVAVADHPAGPWKRFDRPIIDVAPDANAPDALMVSNPSVTRRPDGRFLMVYKAVGRQAPLPFGGPVVHCLALADTPAGPFIKQPGLAFTAPGEPFPAEDPFIWYHTEHGCYYAIVKDMKGVFTGAGTSLALFRSADGLDWRPAPHPLISPLRIPWAGGPQQVARLERPQLWFDQGRPAVLFLAACLDERHSFSVHIPLA
ncbi:MAG: sucrase [Lentisphaerae bacterium]|jgi:hypothetical protein|nr:sucrase [Lentisphaerota bacterium]MBT4814796.1 sucrase [Lentisphaerota bacterium]MBT5611008.1 sucrase [Lentisphaerota bacterium]MBT7061199.1 sucrase [Lentisphaerota bacterium]